VGFDLAAAIRLALLATCVTMYYMETTLNVRIPADLKRQLDALSRRQHRPSSELVRESLRRYIASEQLAALRKTTVPLAEAQGFITDEDIFKAVS
jgi:predicted transcriptional regulator